MDRIVKEAGVAKGTFFAHFTDKDALMDILIGERIELFLDEMDKQTVPENVDQLIAAVLPLYKFITHERYVFDVVLRHSGAAGIEEIGPIARTFGRHNEIVAGWLSAPCYRKDVSAGLLAEGVQAFSVQAMALMFCALHNSNSIEEMLRPYLEAWLLPSGGD